MDQPDNTQDTDDSQENPDTANKLPKFYIAVGASAGGLESIQEFVSRIPPDSDVAIIVIQHLSPDFKSVMAELISRHTVMPVTAATQDMLMLANNIYVIPPKVNMTVVDGHLRLEEQRREQGFSFPIDIFFISLAEDQGAKAIGVILSGTGTDGSRGIKAIKEHEGLVVAENPDTAKFNGMPLSAVNTGLVDFIEEHSYIPGRILRYINHPIVSEVAGSLTEVTEIDYSLMEIFKLLRDEVDIDFSSYKSTTVVRRIQRRIGVRGLNRVQDYHSLLQQDSAELTILAKDLLIGVTRFFRDEGAWKILENKVVPEILRQAPENEPIRVWVAGCSSGEEAYSIAILIDECMRRIGQSREVKIFATDVDGDAIAEASAGRFNLNSRADLSPERLNNYFQQTDKDITVTPYLRKMVVFATHNLLIDPPFSNTHLTLCRNVLIYFQKAAQQRILSMLHFSLQKNGFLFMGSSEALGDLQSHFEIIDKTHRIYKKFISTRLLHERPELTGLAYDVPNVDANTGVKAMPTKSRISADQLISKYHRSQRPAQVNKLYERLINDYAPPAIIISGSLEVQHVFGDVSVYTQKLKAGRFSQSISDYLVPELNLAVSTAVSSANKKEEDVVYQNVQFTGEDGNRHSVDLRVCYAGPKGSISPEMVIIFDSGKAVETSSEDRQAVIYDAGDQVHQRIQDLESELQKNQEHLQVTIEELETTNEELQSSNEELLAANEELQSTNEELQSVNEELYTVNSEYQLKIDELTRLNMDLDNILKSTESGLVFVDSTMLIRKFSPAATKTINFLPTDIGRPFHHISHNLVYDNLLNDLSQVISNNKTIEKEISTTSDEIVLVSISPYFDERDTSDGAVMTITDITEIRRLETKLMDSYNQLRETVNTAFWSRAKNIKLLLVDDDEVDVLAITRALKTRPMYGTVYDIVTVKDADEAASVLTKESFDVCLMDFALGPKDGFEVIRGLEGASRLPAFILLSGVIREDMFDEAIALGIYDIIDKRDMTPQLLHRSIRYTLRHKETEVYLANAPVTLDG